MKKLCFAVLLALFPAVVHAEQPSDFSDISTPSLELPFTVTQVETTGEWTLMRHNYDVAESYDKVLETLRSMFDAKQRVGIYTIMGITEQSGETMTQVILAYRNEHHYVQITPKGAGASLSFEAAPASYVTGAFDAAIYGFTLPDGSEISTVLWNEE